MVVLFFYEGWQFYIVCVCTAVTSHAHLHVCICTCISTIQARKEAETSVKAIKSHLSAAQARLQVHGQSTMSYMYN